MPPKLKQCITRAVVFALGITLAALIRAWAATWRADTEDLEQIDHCLNNGERLLLAFWHGKNFSLFPLAGDRQATIITNESFRGQIAARISKQFGYRAILLPIEKDSHPLSFIKDVLSNDSALVAMAVDGPTGPYHRAKVGACVLANDLGYKLVPVTVISQRKLVLWKRWDRHELPLPFSNVQLLVDNPVNQTQSSKSSTIMQLQLQLTDRLNALETPHFSRQ